MTTLSSVQKTFVRNAWFDITNSGVFSLGKYTEKLESEFARYVGAANAATFSCGTKAIEAAIRLAGRNFRRIYIPELTVPMVRWAAEWAMPNAEVVRVDTDPKTNLMVLDGYEPTEDDCVIMVWTAGIATDEHIARIKQWKAAGVWVVEDCSHAHFLFAKEYTRNGNNSRALGGFGNAGAFSLYPTKAMHAGGDGGLLVSNEDLSWLKAWRNGGKEDNGFEVMIGRRLGRGEVSRMSEIGAATALSFLDNVDQIIDERQHIANVYRGWGIKSLQDTLGVGVNGYKYTVMIQGKARQVEKDMKERGIKYTNRTHGSQDVGEAEGKGTRIAMENHINLPLLRITEQEAHKLAESFRNFREVFEL